jgi:alpha-L-arabinofuranosidase
MNDLHLQPGHKMLTAIFILLVTSFNLYSQSGEKLLTGPGVSVLNIDAERPIAKISEGVYGQFLEHINHSVVDGLFAEQIQGCGFEGKDFATYWKPFSKGGSATVESINFKNGEKSLQLRAEKGSAGVSQKRIFLEAGIIYDGSLWINNTEGSLNLTLRLKDSSGVLIKDLPLKYSGKGWQEIKYSFTCNKTDTKASFELEAKGTGTLLIDYISMMRADVRKNGMLRPDLLNALNDLKPAFVRWPGGSYASIYRWKDAIGPQVLRKYHPNTIWGGYSDYYGFGTDEYLELCRQIKAEPLICLPAPTNSAEDIKYAMDWIHYVNDPATTEWGKQRAANGHPEPYNVKYFQIENEPMNNGFTPETYANTVNIYGSEIRKIDPHITIVACGQKRSNDLEWSQKVIDIAGNNFDVLGCHNYEYENENFQTGIIRIENYLLSLRDYIRNSKHPDIKIGVLEWGLCRTYDWRAGLHTAGILMVYEKLGKELSMSCPALLMRNTTDDPTWTSFIYHDHVTWFPGGGYVVEKLFREHFAENYLASSSGSFSDISNRAQFFDDISQMKPADWKQGTVDAVATGTADGKKIVIKVVNYESNLNTLLTRIKGIKVNDKAEVKIFTLTGGLTEKATLKNPDVYKMKESQASFAKDMAFKLDPYSVSVIEITIN